MSTFPAGRYVCPNCESSVNIFVPLTEAPTHRCSALTEDSASIKNRKSYVMERKGSVRAPRNSVGGLDPSE